VVDSARPSRRKKKKNCKLEQQHIDFLTSQDTLRLWAGKSLLMRCQLFHRKFTDRWTYPLQLSKVYKANGITLKKVRMLKGTGKLTLAEHLE
jgi:transposase/DNA-binding transcriptional MerR regulator